MNMQLRRKSKKSSPKRLTKKINNKIKGGNKLTLSTNIKNKLLMSIEDNNFNLFIQLIKQNQYNLSDEINYYDTEIKTTFIAEAIKNTFVETFTINNLVYAKDIPRKLIDLIDLFLMEEYNNYLTKHAYYSAKKNNLEYFAYTQLATYKQRDFEQILLEELDVRLKNKTFDDLISFLLEYKILHNFKSNINTTQKIKDYIGEISINYPEQSARITNLIAYTQYGGKIKFDNKIKIIKKIK